VEIFGLANRNEYMFYSHHILLVRGESMPSREREHDEICEKINEKLEKCGFKVHRRVLISQSLPNRNERYHLFNYGKLRDITLYTGPRFRKLPSTLP